MKPLKSPFQAGGMMILLTGIILSLGFSFVGNRGASSLLPLAICLLLGGTMVVYAKRAERRCKKLKQSGQCYEAKALKLIPGMGLKIRSSSTFRVQCQYERQGRQYTVTSRLCNMRKRGLALLGSNGMLPDGVYRAMVYVDSNDPSVYEVEVLAQV